MSIDNLHGQFALDLQGVQRLKHSAARDPNNGLEEASRQFEALFLQVMLKSMRDATPKSDLFSSQQSQFYESLMDQQWAQHLAGQGFGLAEHLTAQLRSQLPPSSESRTDFDDLVAGIPRGEPISLTGREIPVEALVQGATEAQAAAPQQLAAGPTIEKGPGAEPRVVTDSARDLRSPWSGNPWPVAAGGRNSPAAAASAPDHVRNFLDRLAEPARRASEASGIPQELMLAQAALETGWGRHGITTADGRDSHNLFGIKAGGGWQGESTEVITHEYVDGRRLRMAQSFRVYDSYEAAFADYARLLASNPRYAGVLSAGDAREAAVALQQGGYATDPRYADKLIGVMELSQASAPARG